MGLVEKLKSFARKIPAIIVCGATAGMLCSSIKFKEIDTRTILDFRSQSYQKIVIKGKTLEELTNSILCEDSTLSPDKKQIAYKNNQDVYVYNIETSKAINLTKTQNAVETPLSWTSDGLLEILRQYSVCDFHGNTAKIIEKSTIDTISGKTIEQATLTNKHILEAMKKRYGVVSALFCALALALAYSAYALRKTYAKAMPNKKGIDKKTTLDFLIDNWHVCAATILPSAILVLQPRVIAEQELPYELRTSAKIFFASAGISFFSLINYASTIIKSAYKRPYLKAIASQIGIIASKSEDEKIKNLEDLCNALRYEGMTFFGAMATLGMLKHDFETACEYLSKLNNYAANTRISDALGELAMLLQTKAGLELAKKRARRQNSAENLLELQLMQVMNKKFGEAEKTGKQIEQQAGSIPEISALQAIIHETMPKNERAEYFWRKLAAQVIEDPLIEFDRIPGTKNDVYELKNKKFLKDTIIIERNKDLEELKKKYDCTRFAHYCIADKNSASKALALLKEPYNSYYFAVYQRAPGKTLENCLTEATSKETVLLLEKAFEKLRDYQKALTEKQQEAKRFGVVLQEYNHQNHFENRFLAQISPIELGERKKEQFRKAYLSISGFLDSQTRCVVHGDFHEGNVIVGRDILNQENICIIDPELLCLSLPERDPARLAARSKKISADLAFGIWSKQQNKESDFVLKKCYYSALHESVSMAGSAKRFSTTNPEESEFWQKREMENLQKAVYFAQKILSEIAEKQEREDFSVIMDCLSELSAKP